MAKKIQPEKPFQLQEPLQPTLSILKQDPNILYKILVLLYDLRNIKSDPTSQTRSLSTTDELYISGPYFTPSEAKLIKSAIVDPTPSPTPFPSPSTINETDNPETPESETTTTGPQAPQTVEHAIQTRLSDFFEKRRASGDARPCGPHDMAPIYENVFGVERGELLDERFLGRLRRGRLGRSEEVKGEERKGGKKGKRGR